MDIPNILKRTWIMDGNAKGFILLHVDPNIQNDDYIPDCTRRYRCEVVEKLSECKTIDPAIKHKLLTAEGDLSGIYFYEADDAYRVLKEWNYRNRLLNQTPFLIYEREALDTAKVNCVVTTSCADYIFVQKQLPGIGPLYRNKETLTNAMQIPGIPRLETLMGFWQDWLTNREIFGYSRKYYCEIAYGYPTKLHLLRERNLSGRWDGDADKHKYYLLQLLSMESYEISELMNMGFVWNRYIQSWAGESTMISIRDLDDFIRKDTLATPATLRFVPEWSAGIELQKLFGHGAAAASRAMRPGVHNFDNSGLWRMIA